MVAFVLLLAHGGTEEEQGTHGGESIDFSPLFADLDTGFGDSLSVAFLAVVLPLVVSGQLAAVGDLHATCCRVSTGACDSGQGQTCGGATCAENVPQGLGLATMGKESFGGGDAGDVGEGGERSCRVLGNLHCCITEEVFDMGAGRGK